MSTQTTSPIQRAADLVGVAVIARACDVSMQAVYKWIKKGHPPTDRCEAVEKAVGGKVSRFDLLPPNFGTRTARTRRTPNLPP